MRTALAESGLDAVVCLLPENVLALSGYWAMNGTCVALVAKDAEPRLIVPRGEETWAGRSGWHHIDVYPSGHIDPDPGGHRAPALPCRTSSASVLQIAVE
jgi:Xaa-Pro aminopeptidase